ncbi:hypothetical protein F2Q70_00004133 [Brassica cretica]|uniref:Uncharacterized protein n=1 Tax=Brassica cretica TaxID=69181 RepID=A0A8S9IZA0_BRACR|nr:hypothetical protein F2Q70_00004133 [Brassica cretica]
MTHKEFAARHSHPPSPVYVNIDRQRETTDDRQPPAPIDRRTPLTYRVQLPKIDIARINALRPQPKPSANPPETASIHSKDAAESMKVDKAHMRRTLRKRKKKISLHTSFVFPRSNPDHYQILSVDFRIPLEKPFDEAYFTLRLWMFFRETKETEEDIRRMFYEAIEKMKNMVTLKKKSDPGKFAKPCTVKGIEFPHSLCDTGASVSIQPRVMAHHLGLKVEPSKETFTSCGLFTAELRRNLQRPRGADCTNQKSIDNQLEESIDSSPDDWENNYYNPTLAEHSARSSPRATPHREEYDADYEEERATEYKGICAEERNYSIGSWANDHYHQSYAVETAVHEPGADEPHEGFTNEELLNHQELSDKNLLFAEACGRGTRFCRPFTRANPPSNDTKVPPSIDIRSQPPSTVREKAKLDNNYQTRDEFGIFRDPKSYARAIDGHALQVSREDITDILHATAQHSRAPAESCKQILQHSWSLKEISSELTIKGRYAEEAIDRCTPRAVDRYRRQASTIEDYDRSMYILYHRSVSRRETHDLVPADFKPKASPNYKIIPDEFLT